ncbi:MAG TPA: hypothetical protein VJJ75_00045 [Candidatus Nanoarchaeia archaeon]|nr:hypothetical protein [Candidatus Nanoarchaeia archaeon]
MQKYALLVLSLVLILPGVGASLTLDGPANTVYNIGDSATLSGLITPAKDMLGLFRIDLRCQGDTQLFVKLMSLKKNQRVSFSESLPVPFYQEGECIFHATVTADHATAEEATSRAFSISKALKGTLAWDKKQVQLGDTATLEGDVYHLDGTGIAGSATLLFQQENATIAADTVQIENGHFSYAWKTQAQPPGIYNAQIDARDTLGNMQIFTSDSITLMGNLSIDLEETVSHVLPRKEITVKGTVTTSAGTAVEDGQVSFTYAGNSYDTKIKGGAFKTTFEILSAAKTENVSVALVAVDKYGNTGGITFSFAVDAVPTTLVFTVPEGEFKPEEKFAVEARVLDQGGDIFGEDIGVDIYNPGGRRVFQEVIASGTSKEFQLPVFAEPGDWKIKASSNDFTSSKTLYVKEVKELDYRLEGNALTVTNIGNVKYDEPVKIAMQGFDRPVNIVRNIDLDVNESVTVNLGEGNPTGAYSVAVGDKVFNDVKVEGFARKDYSWVYYVILGVLIFGLIYFFMLRSSGAPAAQKQRRDEPELDDDMQERLQKDIEQHRLQRQKQHIGRRRVGDAPVLGQEHIRKFDSHGRETLWGQKRETMRKQKDESSGDFFGGMFN